jgi:hypothetical protein
VLLLLLLLMMMAIMKVAQMMQPTCCSCSHRRLSLAQRFLQFLMQQRVINQTQTRCTLQHDAASDRGNSADLERRALQALSYSRERHVVNITLHQA